MPTLRVFRIAALAALVAGASLPVYAQRTRISVVDPNNVAAIPGNVSPRLAAVKDLGLKRLAVFYQNTDWGHSSDVLFEKKAKSLGAQIVTSEGFLMDERDFRSTLTRHDRYRILHRAAEINNPATPTCASAQRHQDQSW